MIDGVSSGRVTSVRRSAELGKVIGLAVGSTARLPNVPGMPTSIEAGTPGFQAEGWNALFAPAGTPRPVVDRVHGTLIAALGNPTVRDALGGQGADPVGSTPEAFAEFTRSEIDKWMKVVRMAGIQPE